MQSVKEQEIVAEISKLLLDIIMLAETPSMPERFGGADHLQDLYANLVALKDLLSALAKGDLSRRVPLKGYFAGTLKTLQANLRHMTWQTKMVASGDFSQRIEFMGDFSASFNAMVVQLDQTMKELVRKKTELSKANKDLLKEITIRKKTEAALRKSEEEARRLATTDALTGLYNRRYFYEIAATELDRALSHLKPLSVAIFDIDFFKRVNDTFGHCSGDRVLQMVAQATREMLWANEIPARYGGEEFIVLFPATPAPQAAVVVERLRRRIAATSLEDEKGPISITASFGVSDCLGTVKGRSKEGVLSEFVLNADRAMYMSKNTGRNRVTIYRPESA